MYWTEIGSNQASVIGPQYQEPENYKDMRADQLSNLPPPPPPPTSEKPDHEVNKSPSPKAEPGVVYCLPAHVPQIALDDLPDAGKDVKKDCHLYIRGIIYTFVKSNVFRGIIYTFVESNVFSGTIYIFVESFIHSWNQTSFVESFIYLNSLSEIWGWRIGSFVHPSYEPY